MIEQEYLKYCLEAIEEKLNWKPSSEWRESDFIRLSEAITEKSGISISPHTLKRLFGKIKYKKFYNPQQATKDALAKFLDYQDWGGFVSSRNSRGKENNSSKGVTKNKKGKKLVAVGVVAFIVLLLVLVLSNVNFEWENISKKEDFNFSLTDAVGVVPYTVALNYDISNLSSDSVMVDFGFNHPIRGQQTMLVDKAKFLRNFTYQIPGQYKIRLKDGDKVLKSTKVLAKSKTWESYFNPETAIGEFWINNKIESKPFTGSLYYPPTYLDSVGFDSNQVFYLTHRLFREFDIDGDNFELKTRFKSSEDLGGITCYDFIIRVICENEGNNIKLMEKGCSQFSGMKIGETVLSGVHEDLSSFKFNLGVWNNLKVSIKDKNAEVHINNRKIFTGDYKKSNGKIIGLEIVFKGSGMLDYLHLRDLISNKKFRANFK